MEIYLSQPTILTHCEANNESKYKEMPSWLQAETLANAQ